MRGTGTGRHGNGARHAQRTNDPPRSCVSACRVAPLYPVRSRSRSTTVRGACVRARARHVSGRRARGTNRCAACVYARARAQGSRLRFLETHLSRSTRRRKLRGAFRESNDLFFLSLFFSCMEIWEYAGSVYTGGDGGIFFWTVDRSFVDRLLFGLKLVFRRKRERWDVRRQMFLFFFRCGKFYLGLFGIGLILVF